MPKDRQNPGFQPIDPWKSDLISYSRRNLPHFEVSDATYFVTFHTRFGLLLPPAARDQVMRVIEGCDNNSLELQAAVVMPDHVHLLFKILQGSLANLLQKIKGSSARRVNILPNRTGSLWIGESFDHIIRHGAELQEKLEYIQNNPVRKGLASTPEQYQWIYVTNKKSQAKACATESNGSK